MKKPIGSLDPALTDVHIWGAGVSGLLMAHFLRSAGWNVHLYEKSSRIGGKIRSHKIEEGVYEEGPNALYATREVEEWLKELGLEVLPATTKLKRRIWRGRAQAPLTPGEVLALLPRLFKRSPSLETDKSLADFFRPLLQEKIETLLTPALQGIYGVGADQLSVKSIWPQLKAGSYLSVIRQLKGPKARSVSFKLGMQEFIDRLAQDFKDQIQLNCSEFVLRPNTILCTNTHEASEVLRPTHPRLAQLLQGIHYQKLSSVMSLTPPVPEMQQTFGFLFPRSVGIQSLGVLFNREIFPGRCGITFIVGENQRADSIVRDDLLRLRWTSSDLRVHSWEKALPIYNSSRAKAIESLHAEQISNLVLFGNYVAGISLRDMITAARNFSQNYKRSP